MKKILTSVALLALLVSGCSRDERTDLNLSGGVFVVNEGPYSNGSGSISFLKKQPLSAENDLFGRVNNRPVGSVPNSMTLHNGKGYIVVNNSGRVEIVNASTLASEGNIPNLLQPRYMVCSGNTGYVSEWGATASDGSVAVVDLVTRTVTRRINTGVDAEAMLLIDNKLWVCNSSYSFGAINDNRVAVIDILRNTVTHITVGDAPYDLVKDGNGDVWVLCKGKKVYDASFNLDLTASTAASLVRIDPSTQTVEQTLTFADKSDSPDDLEVARSGQQVFFNTFAGVFAVPITATALPTSPLFRGNFYALGVDPSDGLIYAADPLNYQSEGFVYRFNTNGAKQDSVRVGQIPTFFVF